MEHIINLWNGVPVRERVRAVISLRGMSHAEVSKATGFAVVTIGGLLTGRFPLTMVHLGKFSAALGVPIESFFSTASTTLEEYFGELTRDNGRVPPRPRPKKKGEPKGKVGRPKKESKAEA